MGSILPKEHIWDKHAIKAAISRKGLSLSELARLNNMPATTLRTALNKPSKKGEIVIANFLGIKLHVLFPERWNEDGKRIYQRTYKKEV